MCGIFGHYSLQGADNTLVRRMAQKLSHRGPDGYDTYHCDQLAFGATRLAIIDLSAPAGPLFNETGDVGIVFNGEIYNYRALKAELQRCGHVFQTATDTEVIVHGYEEWGLDVIERLQGMFAIAIWDANQQRLILVRDRLGEKPLYYTHTQTGDLLFASEIKALFLSPQLTPRLNADALPFYLTVGYVPAPQTMFADIQKIAPGEMLVVDNHSVASRCYWTPQLDASHNELDYSAAVKQIRVKVEAAIEARMVSDVPVGAFLSGGVDSTAVVGVMQQLTHQPVNTFTVGFNYPAGSHGDKKFNVDLHHAAAVAKHFGTQHHAIMLAESDAAQMLPQLVYQMDEPVLQYSMIQTAYVTALARAKGVPVLLTGDAGDELFLGYPHYHADLQLQKVLLIPALLRQGVFAPLARLIPRFRNWHSKLVADVPVQRYLEWLRFLSIPDTQKMLKDSDLAANVHQTLQTVFNPILEKPNTPYFADRIAYTSLQQWIPECSNMRVDKMSMMNSIESRSPFQDHQLVEAALKLPLRYKLENGITKRILKDAMSDILPQAIINRPKWGFMPPTSDWLRTIFRPYIDKYLSPEYVEAAGICDSQFVQKMVHDHLSRKHYYMNEIWALLLLHLWHALFISGELQLPAMMTVDDIVAGSTITVQE